MTTQIMSICGKQPHPTKQAALDHRAALIRIGARGPQLGVYRCPECSRPCQPAVWHVGHRPGSARKRLGR